MKTDNTRRWGHVGDDNVEADATLKHQLKWNQVVWQVTVDKNGLWRVKIDEQGNVFRSYIISYVIYSIVRKTQDKNNNKTALTKNNQQKEQKAEAQKDEGWQNIDTIVTQWKCIASRPSNIMLVISRLHQNDFLSPDEEHRFFCSNQSKRSTSGTIDG